MCDPSGGVLTMLGLGGAGAGAATAAGATAAAATAGGLATTLQTVGLLAGVGGTIYSGVSAYQTARTNAKLIETQRKSEANLAAVKDQRERSQFSSAIRKQFAELASRGVALNSPTALLLGETAAREMSFNSQATRQSATARDAELSVAARTMRARGMQSLFGETLSAAGKTLMSAPDIWPELLA